MRASGLRGQAPAEEREPADAPEERRRGPRGPLLPAADEREPPAEERGRGSRRALVALVALVPRLAAEERARAPEVRAAPPASRA